MEKTFVQCIIVSLLLHTNNINGNPVGMGNTHLVTCRGICGRLYITCNDQYKSQTCDNLKGQCKKLCHILYKNETPNTPKVIKVSNIIDVSQEGNGNTKRACLEECEGILDLCHNFAMYVDIVSMFRCSRVAMGCKSNC